jgi:transcriptional regulator with XRE-family HTH domain
VIKGGVSKGDEMSHPAFSEKVKAYLKAAGYSQKVLANALGLDQTLLNHKLNGTGRTLLTHPEVREIIKQLAGLEAISRQGEALELLALADCPNFPQEAWKLAPLNKLESANELELQLRSPTSAEPTYTFPQNLTPILGRKEEIRQILELLSNPHPRLITLTGAGGSGKTSLALEVGNQLPPAYTHQPYFVRLEHITRQESMLAEIAGTLKVKETPGQDLLQCLKEYLSDKELLLILDNLEQLAAETGILGELLKGTRSLKLLVTSRIPLQLSFEYEFPVDPLALPDKQDLGRFGPVELIAAYPGIALFAARAKAVKPDFSISQDNMQAVVEICRKVDGLPLALELAAARIRTYPPHKLLERLSLKVLAGGARDLPARQKTLWDTIEWSYQFLLLKGRGSR